MDYFLDDSNIITRLVNEWNKHGELIIAYDYDSTVFDYGDKGRKFNDVISLLQKCKMVGAKFIVFTCCGEEKYESIKKYLINNNIPFDKINENIEGLDFGGRKIYYNILLDDRAGLSSAYNCLLKAIEIK